MSELRLASEKRLRIFSGRGFPELAEQVASELGIPLTPTSSYDFEHDELYILFQELVRDSDAFAIQRTHIHVPQNHLKQLTMVDHRSRS